MNNPSIKLYREMFIQVMNKLFHECMYLWIHIDLYYNYTVDH
jgi:hypothetical protein